MFIKAFITLLLVNTFAISAEQAKPLKTLKLALNWVPEPEFGGFYQASIQQLYEKNGLQVELIQGGAGAPTVQMVAAGSVDMGIASAAEVLTAIDRGADLVCFFAVYQTSPLVIMTHASRNLEKLSDVFQSGILSIEQGQAFAMFLKKKYDFSKVKVVPYSGGVGLFIRDPQFAQQGFLFSEPILAEAKGIKTKSFLVSDSGYNPYIEVVVVRRKFLEENRDLLKSFVLASREGWIQYIKSPEKTNEAMSKLNRAMSLETFHKGSHSQISLLESPESKANGFGYIAPERMTQLASQLLELKILKRKSEVGRTFVNF